MDAAGCDGSRSQASKRGRRSAQARRRQRLVRKEKQTGLCGFPAWPERPQLVETRLLQLEEQISKLQDVVNSSIEMVRDMASRLQLEVDSRQRKADETVSSIKTEIMNLNEKREYEIDDVSGFCYESTVTTHQNLEQHAEQPRGREDGTPTLEEIPGDSNPGISDVKTTLPDRVSQRKLLALDAGILELDDRLSQIEATTDSIERNHSTTSEETTKRFNAMELRIGGVLDLNKLADKVEADVRAVQPMIADWPRACEKDVEKLNDKPQLFGLESEKVWKSLDDKLDECRDWADRTAQIMSDERSEGTDEDPDEDDDSDLERYLEEAGKADS